MELELGEKLIVRNDVKAFCKIEKAEEGNVAAVHVGKDLVGDRQESGFRGMTRTKTVLGW